jgi:hypothetical protein
MMTFLLRGVKSEFYFIKTRKEKRNNYNIFYFKLTL